MAKVRVDLTPIVKRLMLQIITLHEQVTAMRFALEDSGILTAELKDSAMERSREFWRHSREAVEREGATDEELLLKILREFEGPVQ